MFRKGSEIVDLAFLAIRLDLPQTNVVVAARRGQTSFAAGLKVS
jgi:hypothetical protein